MAPSHVAHTASEPLFRSLRLHQLVITSAKLTRCGHSSRLIHAARAFPRFSNRVTRCIVSTAVAAARALLSPPTRVRDRYAVRKKSTSVLATRASSEISPDAYEWWTHSGGSLIAALDSGESGFITRRVIYTAHFNDSLQTESRFEGEWTNGRGSRGAKAETRDTREATLRAASL